MLQSLHVKNFAIIDETEVDFREHLNIMTGETGAGKSIIIDSLNLVLGERADKELVRTGTSKARVEGIFNIEKNTNLIL